MTITSARPQAPPTISEFLALGLTDRLSECS